MLIQILRGTPMWVFVLFAYLVWIGVKRLQPGVRDVRWLWITPAIFIAWGLLGLMQRNGAFAQTLTGWLMGATLGGMVGFAPDQRLVVDRVHRRVLQPACAVPLIRNVSIFGAHYGLNVAAKISPALHDVLMNWDVVVSGLGAGYFVGWALRFARNYRNAPQADLRGGDLQPAKISLESPPAIAGIARQ